jgi:hypothetical protein
MVVWQPFTTCWRYIIARVSEMHVAYHKGDHFWYIYISGTNNIQHLKQRRDISLFPSLPASLNVCVCVGGEGG